MLNIFKQILNLYRHLIGLKSYETFNHIYINVTHQFLLIQDGTYIFILTLTLIKIIILRKKTHYIKNNLL